MVHAALADLDTKTSLAVHDTVVALEWDAKQANEELTTELDELASTTGMVFGKAVPGQEQDATTMTVFLYGNNEVVAAGIPGAPVDGYSTGNHIFYRSSADLGMQPPIGRYFVYGTDADADRLATFLSDHGFTVNAVIDSDDPLARIQKVSPQSETSAKLVALVVLVVAGGVALLRRREHSVAFLQGLSWWNQWLSHMRSALLGWAITGMLVLPFAALHLWHYNNGSGWALYLGSIIGFSFVLLVIDLVVTAVALALLARLPVPRSLAGALPVRTVVVSAYVVVIVTALVLVSSVSAAVGYRADLEARSDSLEPYAETGDAITLTITFLNRQTEEKDFWDLGLWLSEVDKKGDVILAAKSTLQVSSPSLLGHPVLYVNDQYLEEQLIPQKSGADFLPDQEKATVLIPESLWGERGLIMDSINWDFLLKEGSESRYDPVPVKIRDNDYFTYSTRGFDFAAADEMSADASSVTNPIIVSFPSATSPMNPAVWASAATGGQVVFPEPEVVEQALIAHPDLHDVILYTSPIAGEAKSGYLEAMHDFRASLMAVILSAAVLLASSLLVTYLYTRAAAQWIFAYHLHGWRFVGIHRWFLSAQSVILVVIATWIPYRVWQSNREYYAAIEAGAPPRVAPSTVGLEDAIAIGTVVTLLVAITMIATAIAQRRIIRQGSAEA